MIPLKPYRYLHNYGNVAPVRALKSLTFKSSKQAYGIKFLRPLAQWLNGMSHTVTSLLIPIQLCGGKKTKCHRYKCTYDISVFLPRFNAKSRYCNDRICKFLVIIYVCN